MKYITFGELMLRLSPPGYRRFIQTDSFDASYAGAEANVAVSLANYGCETEFITKLPENELGFAARNALRRYGVMTDRIVFGGKRLGVYFVEKGASQRPGKVIYDRAASSIAEAAEADFDWDAIFDGCGWFHFTGITPALSDSLAASCLKAVIKAKEKGLTVSCDLNYRSKLWSREKACGVMSELMRFTDICVANEEDAGDVFGIYADDSDINGGKLSRAGYESVARRLAERFGFSHVAITLRGSISASENEWAAMLFDGKGCVFSDSYRVHIVDRVGGGDSFCGGLIYALGNGFGSREAIGFAAAASCLKHSVEGDFNLASAAEVNALCGGNGSGRVVR